MKIFLSALLISPLLVLAPSLNLTAQTRTMSFDATTSLLLEEFKAMLTFEDDAISVALRMGRAEANSGEDRLEKGDIVLMMNGKRATDIETLRALYEGLEKDEEIKIGVRRGEQRFILNAVKGNVPEGESRMVMRMETDGDGTAPTIVPEIGALLVDKDDAVVVERVLDMMMPEELKPLGLQGYVVAELNGEKPKNALNAKELLEGLDIGSEISITFEKDGDTKSITFKKAEPSGNFSFSTDNK